MRARDFRPAPRKDQPAGEFIENNGWDFVQARRWLWQWMPPLRRWVAIDG
jgi:hypothetical protein